MLCIMKNLENNLIFCKKYLKIINFINLDIIKNTLILIDRGIFLLQYCEILSPYNLKYERKTPNYD